MRQIFFFSVRARSKSNSDPSKDVILSLGSWHIRIGKLMAVCWLYKKPLAEVLFLLVANGKWFCFYEAEGRTIFYMKSFRKCYRNHRLRVRFRDRPY